MQVLTEELKKAQIYERNKQWSSAGAVYQKELRTLFRDNHQYHSIPYIAELETALRKITSRFEKIDGSKNTTLQKLWKEIKLHWPITAGDMTYAISYESHYLTEGSWVICFLSDLKKAKYGEAAIGFPIEPTHLFIVRIEAKAISVKLLKPETAHLYAYLFAHLGLAQVETIIPLYSVNRLFIQSGEPAVEKASMLFIFALSIKPDYAWAMARLGNLYRIMGNGWWENVASSKAPDKRVAFYLKALMYFREALNTYCDNEPGQFWAYSHTGAAIVNIRSFAPAKSTEIPAVTEFFSDWLDFDLTNLPIKKFEFAIIQFAIDCLEMAMKLRGEYYPWAELYLGGAYIVKSFLERPKSLGAVATSQRSTATILDGYLLQPKLLLSVSEPDLLDNSPLISFALLNLWTGNYQKAWSYAGLALKRNFGEAYMMGFNKILLYQLLIDISFESLASAKSQVVVKHPIPEGTVPSEPFTTWQNLTDFIFYVFDNAVHPAAKPFLLDEIELSTKLSIGLQGINLGVFNMANILHYINNNSGDKSILSGEKYKSIIALMNELSAKLGVKAPLVPTHLNKKVLDEAIFSLLNTGFLGYSHKVIFHAIKSV